MIKIEMNKKIDLKKVNDKEYKIKIDFEILYNIYNMLNIIKFIKSNDMLYNIKFEYRQHYRIDNKHLFTIMFDFKEYCTLKYCRNYEYIVYQYIKQFFKKISNDYESKVDSPIIDVLI